MFSTSTKYKRQEVWRKFGLDEALTKGGAYATGYAWVQNSLVVFANVNVAGRTGHDYENEFIGDRFIWWSKTHRTTGSPEISKMLDVNCDIFVFFRNNDKALWNYWGNVRVAERMVDMVIRGKDGEDVPCVRIVLEIKDVSESVECGNPDEMIGFTEGKTRSVLVNIHERNPAARRACMDHYGPTCQVCNVNFKDVYPGVGDGFIHVHHLKMLADITDEYVIDPIADLRPVCPNCHAMIHRRKIPYGIDELKTVICAVQRMKA